MFLQTDLAKVIYVGCVTLFLTSLGCWALLAHQDVGTMNGRHAGQVVSDEKFAREAAQGGMAEVKLGELAQSRGSREAVKTFAQRMIVQHSRANDQLKQIARQANITLPGDLAAKDQNTYDALAKLSGDEFDRAYARDMVDDHVADLAAFQREANAGRSDSERDGAERNGAARNEDIKTFASQSLPMLREHLNQAREMLKAVSPGSASRVNGHGRVHTAR